MAHVGELVGELAGLTCPDCGLKFMEFRAGAGLGCPHDYQVFARGLLPLVQPRPRRDPARRQGRRHTARGAAAAGERLRLRPSFATPSPAKITSRRPGSATSSASRTPTHEPGRLDPNLRRMAPRHRPRERHRDVLAHPPGAQPRRLPLHQPGQPRREGRDRGQRQAGHRPRRSRICRTSTSTP